jgi:tRNA threonylcarbamoyladenosine biosynthesis protein TsaB
VKLLALDTSTAACTVALWRYDERLERIEFGAQHSERILAMVRDVLAEAGLALTQLDAIAFGRGPGLFTGLRIGAGVAQGLAFGADLPVVAVSSLAALAQGQAAASVLAAFDARMHQVYFGAYRRNARGIVELTGSELVVAPKAVAIPEGAGWVGAGSGWDEYHAELSQRLGDRVVEWHPRAFPRGGDVAQLGAVAYEAGALLSPEQALPIYLRDEVAVKQGKR